MSEGDFPYKSLSTIAREFLPRAEKMHNEGMSWREVSRNLKVSYSALFIWRRPSGRQSTQAMGSQTNPGVEIMGTCRSRHSRSPLITMTLVGVLLSVGVVLAETWYGADTKTAGVSHDPDPSKSYAQATAYLVPTSMINTYAKAADGVAHGWGLLTNYPDVDDDGTYDIEFKMYYEGEIMTNQGAIVWLTEDRVGIKARANVSIYSGRMTPEAYTMLR